MYSDEVHTIIFDLELIIEFISSTAKFSLQSILWKAKLAISKILEYNTNSS